MYTPFIELFLPEMIADFTASTASDVILHRLVPAATLTIAHIRFLSRKHEKTKKTTKSFVFFTFRAFVINFIFLQLTHG